MISRMKSFEVIALRRQGYSFSEIARQLNINRKTASSVCKEYEEALKDIDEALSQEERDEAAFKLIEGRKYDASNRKKRAFTTEVKSRMEDLIEDEKVKDQRLGSHKQKLNAKQVHEILEDEGFKISYRTTAKYWSELNQKSAEAFIQQRYDFGDRLEFDFGEIKLLIEDTTRTFYLAVLASPASDFYWAFIYTNQKQEVFFDAQIRFFEMVGGVYDEVVYDNMRNVVSRFIGRNEKELNQELINFSLYYDFTPNVTNCFRGNEKGTVEGRVKHIRQACFSKKYSFNSLQEAETYLHNQLVILNKDSRIKEEKAHLRPLRSAFELAELRRAHVNKYSCIQVDKVSYSVPDYLVGQKVQVKNYHDRIVVYLNQERLCEHKKIEGAEESLNIDHYLKTFLRKPGALKNSQVLKSNPDLALLYYNYYTEKPKLFVELLQKTQGLDFQERLIYLRKEGLRAQKNKDQQKKQAIDLKTRYNLSMLNQIYGMEG